MQLIGAVVPSRAQAVRAARDHRRRDVWRYQVGGDRGVSRAGQRGCVHPVSAWPRVRCAAPPDDHPVRSRTFTRWRVDGDFDICQALVKDMFNDFTFRDEVGLAGVNSINWARVLAQVVYYFSAAVTLGAPHRPVSFTVPHGQFRRYFRGLHRPAPWVCRLKSW